MVFSFLTLLVVLPGAVFPPHFNGCVRFPATRCFTRLPPVRRSEDAFVHEPETRDETVGLLQRAVADETLNIKTHRDRMVPYQQCFVASEFVDWLMAANPNKIRKRSQAEAIGQILLSVNPPLLLLPMQR
jgi:hypothetical protein